MTREQLRRKADQAWEMAGLARQDGDRVDEKRRTEEAREYERQLGELHDCEICNFCHHSLERNSHGPDQNDFSGTEYLGRCCYCRECSAGRRLEVPVE
jgi:hypothetical protein